jgi:C-terminal processing protease CtpA/Prc
MLLVVCAGRLAIAQHNPGFEADLRPARQGSASWHSDDSDDGVELDGTVAHGGDRSLRLERSERGTTRVTQTISRGAITGDRILVSAYLKTTDISGGYAGLWLRVAGAEDALYFDSMRDRGVARASPWTRYELQAPFPPEAEAVSFGPILRGVGTAWFDDFSVAGLRTADLPPPDPAARAYLERALDLMQANSVNRAAIIWPDFRAAILRQARGARKESDTYLALRYALRRLGDGHSFLLTPERSAAASRETFSNVRTGRRSQEPRGELLTDPIAYVWMPGFSGGTHVDRRNFAAQLQELLARLDGSDPCGWILDVRDNNGGSLWPMLAGIGPLLGEGDAGAAIYPDGRRVRTWYRDGQAGFGDFTQLRVAGEVYEMRAATPPVAILTGRETASSGELIAMAFRGRVNTRSFGQATRGVSSGNRTFALSDGAELILTVATTGDRAGNVYSGAIEPDEPLEEADRERPLAEQPAIGAAIGWLLGQAACRAS